jgi:glycine reductase
MGTPVRVVHYLNQFFAGLGGEEPAGVGVAARDGAVGSGRCGFNADKGKTRAILEVLDTALVGVVATHEAR